MNNTINIHVIDPKNMTFQEKDRLIKRDKEIEAARKLFSDKASALLTPEQRAAWKQLQGRTFTFRQNEY